MLRQDETLPEAKVRNISYARNTEWQSFRINGGTNVPCFINEGEN